MAQVIWTLRALNRLEVIRDFISNSDPIAADRVIEAIFQRTERLKSFPRSGQQIIAPADREIREIGYGHYRIFYEVMSEETIQIISILHSSLNIRDYLDL